jgi:hypothetical protein
MIDKERLWQKLQDVNARLAWMRECRPKQQIRIDVLLAEANRVSKRYAEVGYLVLIKDRFDEPLG